MKKLRVLLSLATDASDFQREQARDAGEAAQRLGVEIKIIYAQNDAFLQNEQLLTMIQGESATRSDAIMVHPAGRTALPNVARAAVGAGLGWVVLNWSADYVAELRQKHHVPVFVFSSDQKEIGRIQGRQLESLLPDGGSVLYIQGPSNSPAAQQRTEGMHETKPENIQIRILKCENWTEQAGHNATGAWLRLSTSQKQHIDAVAAQSDFLAMGARKALHEQDGWMDRKMMNGLCFTGVDGLPHGGQSWVQKGLLAATIVVPANAGAALELLTQAMKTGAQPSEISFTVPASYPPIEALHHVRK